MQMQLRKLAWSRLEKLLLIPLQFLLCLKISLAIISWFFFFSPHDNLLHVRHSFKPWLPLKRAMWFGIVNLTVSKSFFFSPSIIVKYMWLRFHHFNHLEVNSSEAFGTLTACAAMPQSTSRTFSSSQTESLYPLSNNSYSPHPSAPGNLYPTFYLCEFVYSRYLL